MSLTNGDPLPSWSSNIPSTSATCLYVNTVNDNYAGTYEFTVVGTSVITPKLINTFTYKFTITLTATIYGVLAP